MKKNERYFTGELAGEIAKEPKDEGGYSWDRRSA
jgi:inosine/xanthosine triphosphate pyrophosphatase family protein